MFAQYMFLYYGIENNCICIVTGKYTPIRNRIELVIVR